MDAWEKEVLEMDGEEMNTRIDKAREEYRAGLVHEVDGLQPKIPCRGFKVVSNLISWLLIIGGLILVGLLGVIAIIIQLALAFIFTVYVITFSYGLFINTSLFATQSIFSIPFNEVVAIGFMNPWLFWGIFITMILRSIVKQHNDKKKNCVLKR